MSMNVLMYELAEGEIRDDTLTVEDNIGESIHIHWGKIRIEMSIDDYHEFSNQLQKASNEFKNGNN